MIKKENYNTADVEIIKIKYSDIITSSTIDTGKDDMDDDGWTKIDKNW